MFREIGLKDALEKLLEETTVLAAPINRNENPEKIKYTFRSLNEILNKYRFLVEDTEKKCAEHTTDLDEHQKVEINQPVTEVQEKKETVQNTLTSVELKETREEDGYSGFLHIRCECGRSKSFCTKNRMQSFKCEACGKTTELRNLKRAYINCECGSIFKYRTNETAGMFDLKCLGCGQPVALKYNEKKKLYETIKE